MKWISVEDWLPKGRNRWGSCWWLVKPQGRIPTSALFIDNKWLIDGKELEVTHWMPLPPDPPQD